MFTGLISADFCESYTNGLKRRKSHIQTNKTQSCSKPYLKLSFPRWNRCIPAITFSNQSCEKKKSGKNYKSLGLHSPAQRQWWTAQAGLYPAFGNSVSFILLRAAKWNKVLSAYITAASKERGSLTKAPAGIKASLCYRFSAKTLNTVIISKNRSIWRNYLRNMSWTPATVFSAW